MLKRLKVRDAKTVKGKFKASTAAEKQFYRALKRVAEHAGHIVETNTNGDDLEAAIANNEKMQRELENYSKRLGPWAESQSAKLLEQVQRSNKRAYRNASKAIGTALDVGVARQQTGEVAAALMTEQVNLIKSIPLEAGLRAQKIAREAILHGNRAQPDADTINQLKQQLGFSTKAAVSRAKLIAVTETARANASFTQSRATAVGAEAYIWRATMDGATRESHAKMNGKVIKYDEPPTLSDGTKGHAGTFPNCRCYQEPVFTDE